MAPQDSLSHQAALAGQAVYSPMVLALYDWWVLGLSNRWIWRCPTNHLLDHFNRYVTANHLDVGVGTGYFLDHAYFPSSTPRLALLDLNPTCLMTTATRVGRYQPTVYQANILKPLPLTIRGFDSISLNYILHCLPGTLITKTAVFEHLKIWLNPGGVIFGSTLLHDGTRKTWVAKQLMKIYNNNKIFSNTADDLKSLQRSLDHHFTAPTLEVRGSVALFSGTVP